MLFMIEKSFHENNINHVNSVEIINYFTNIAQTNILWFYHIFFNNVQ